jgi:transposase-like protein
LTTVKVTPTEVVADAAPVYPAVLDELVPSVWHHVEQYAHNPIGADHSRLKHRLTGRFDWFGDVRPVVVTAASDRSIPVWGVIAGAVVDVGAGRVGGMSD